jgi:hypothetical protein
MKSIPIFVRLRQFAPLAILLGSVVVAVAACLQALNFPFISDDSYYLTGNAKLSGLQLTELWRLLIEPYNPYEFLPLRDFSYWLDLALFGLSPAAFRLHNILLYLLCCLGVFGTTYNLWQHFRSGQSADAPWVAAIVTALFAIHPAHVEAVVWVSGRKDVLSGMFAMLSLWLATQAKRQPLLSPRYATASLLIFVAATLSKATAVAMAPVIALVWFLFWRSSPAPGTRRLMLLWPLGVLLLAACIAPVFTANSTVKLVPYWGFEAYTRALAVLGWMVRLAVTPGGHHYAYPVFEDPWLPAMLVTGAVVLFAAVAGIIILLRKGTLEGFALVAFALLCMPYTQFSPYITHSLVTDRFLFLALWPFLVLLVALAWRLSFVPRIVVLLLIALAWTVQTVERPRDWANYETLIAADLRAYPGYYYPLFQNIEEKLSTGQYLEAREIAEGITDIEVRKIIIKLVEGAYAVAVDAVQTGDPRNAMARLQNLGLQLKQPLVQAQWNTPLFSFWLSSRNILALEWQTLAGNFPNDVTVQQALKLRQESGF